LKNTKRNIYFAWLLLMLFAAGQYLVFAHQHYKQGNVISSTKTVIPVLKEKCDICDVMHHTHMLVVQHVYFTPIVAVLCHYQVRQSDVKFIQLVIAAGRAPPVS
jgi:hypothetical protein